MEFKWVLELSIHRDVGVVDYVFVILVAAIIVGGVVLLVKMVVMK